MALATDDKFILRRLTDAERATWAKHSDAGRWGFFKLAEGQSVPGAALPTALCGTDLTNCSWGAVEFEIKNGTLTWRWYKDGPINSDDWLIEGGKCSAL